jgi:thymidylate kinase
MSLTVPKLMGVYCKLREEVIRVPEMGKLLVFEGPDGVGKSTLAQALADHLNVCSIPCEYLAFPGREPGTLGHHIYQIQHHASDFDIQSMSEASRQLLHVAAHIDVIENRILPLLKQGHFVVLDRFWWSTWVYGLVGGARRRSLKAMLNLEAAQWGKVPPAVTFLITRSRPWREGEAADDRWHRLRSTYHALADTEKRRYPVYSIDNNGSVHEGLREILEALCRSVDGLPAEVSVSPEVSDNAQLRLDLDDGGDVLSANTTSLVIKSLLPAKPTEVYDTYWRFAAMRQSIFFGKLEGSRPPWTTDLILQKHKFTNAYRASDRVSQYLIRHVIYEGDQSREEVFFRTLLFRIFNRIETWELLREKMGTISYADYSFERYDEVFTAALAAKETIFSAAYIMPSGQSSFGYERKHRNYLKLLEKLMVDEIPVRLSDLRAMRQLFELLRSYPTLGDFLAYQYSIDINYSNLVDFSEMEFVVPGPGARDGIRKCFQDSGGLSEADLIRLVAERQEDEFARLGIEFRSLWGRPLQLIDCQNLFCEVDKYARMAHPNIKGISDRKRIKQTYQPHTEQITYWYPPKWGINHLINSAIVRTPSERDIGDDKRESV